MSEFTAGVLFLSRDRGAFEPGLTRLPTPYLLRTLNPKWSALFLQDEWLGLPQTAEALQRLSLAAPLFYFYYAEDHGWGYRVFAEGKEVATLAVFRRFGCNDMEIARLTALLTPAFIAEHGFEEQAEGFRKLLGIEEMEWMSYRYLQDED